MVAVSLKKKCRQFDFKFHFLLRLNELGVVQLIQPLLHMSGGVAELRQRQAIKEGLASDGEIRLAIQEVARQTGGVNIAATSRGRIANLNGIQQKPLVFRQLETGDVALPDDLGVVVIEELQGLVAGGQRADAVNAVIDQLPLLFQQFSANAFGEEAQSRQESAATVKRDTSSKSVVRSSLASSSGPFTGILPCQQLKGEQLDV